MLGGADIPDVRQKDGVLWDEVSVDFIVFGCRVGHTQRHDIVPPESLFHDSVEVDEGVPVGELWQTVRAHNSIKLGLYLPQDIWLKRQREESGLNCGERLQ